MDTFKLIGILCMIHTTSSPLPDTANRVNSCPEPNNKSAWERASKRINCSGYRAGYSIDIIKTLLIYHCLPSHNLNEKIEFCGRIAAIDKGECPIYNYEHGATVATGRSCAKFTRGCPDPEESPYFSWDFYKYDACLDINEEDGCYYAEPNCPKKESRSETTETTAKTDETLLMTSTTTVSTSSAEVDNSSLWTIIGVLVVCLCCSVFGLLFLIKRTTKRDNCPEEETMLKPINEHENNSQSSSDGVDKLTTPEPVVCNEHPQSKEGQDVGSSIFKLCEDLPRVLYSDLLFKLKEAMTEDFCHRIIHVLKDQKKDLNILNRIHEAKELIDYMDGNYLKRNDVIYVQIISWKLKALSLYELCLDYAKSIPKDVSFVEIKTEKDKTKCIIQCPQQSLDEKQKTKLIEMLASYLRFDDCVFKDSHDDNSEVQTMVKKAVDCPKESDKNKEKKRLAFHMANQSESAKEDLRNWIEKFNESHTEKNNYEVLPESPNVEIYSLSYEHAEAILKKVKTDEGKTDAFKKKVTKIIDINEVITIEEALNGSNFVHVNLLMNKDTTEEGLKEVASKFVKVLGVKMEGNTVYVRGNTCESGGIIFIKKNRNSLLNNLELSTLLSNEEVVSCFDEDDIARIKSFENRRSKVDHFLKICTKLPTVKLEKVLPHLEKFIPSCTASPSSSELDSARDWIHQNRDILLDELDLDFIETSLSSMDDVPCEVTNGGKSRRERIQNFIEFVLQTDDAIMLLQKKMAEFVSQTC